MEKLILNEFGSPIPVCANCMYMIEGKYFNTCKPIGGIIPKECADNLTCVSKCHSQPNFVPKGHNDPEAYKRQRYGDRYFRLPSPEEFTESINMANMFINHLKLKSILGQKQSGSKEIIK